MIFEQRFEGGEELVLWMTREEYFRQREEPEQRVNRMCLVCLATARKSVWVEQKEEGLKKWVKSESSGG